MASRWDTHSCSRGVWRPSFAFFFTLEIKKAQGRPGADRTHGPPATKKAGGSHHRFGRTSGLPCAMVLTVSSALSLGTGLSCPHHERIVLLAWHQRRDARTTRLRRPRSLRSSGAPSASTASRLTFVTIAIRPLPRRDRGKQPYFSEKRKQNIFRCRTGQ